MGAKNTVMNWQALKQKLSYLGIARIPELRMVRTELEYLLKAQAEISFKAGIREVVSDITKLMDCRLAPETFATKVCDYCEAKLKEWGVESPVEKPLFSAGCGGDG